jgi:hypothetical protein
MLSSRLTTTPLRDDAPATRPGPATDTRSEAATSTNNSLTKKAFDNLTPLPPSSPVKEGLLSTLIQNSIASTLLSLLEEIDLLLVQLDEPSTAPSPVETESSHRAHSKKGAARSEVSPQQASSAPSQERDSRRLPLITEPNQRSSAASTLLQPSPSGSGPSPRQVSPESAGQTLALNGLPPNTPEKTKGFTSQIGITNPPGSLSQEQTAEPLADSNNRPFDALKARTTQLTSRATIEKGVDTWPFDDTRPFIASTTSALSQPASDLQRIRELIRTLLTEQEGREVDSLLKTLVNTLPENLLKKLLRNRSLSSEQSADTPQQRIQVSQNKSLGLPISQNFANLAAPATHEHTGFKIPVPHLEQGDVRSLGSLNNLKLALPPATPLIRNPESAAQIEGVIGARETISSAAAQIQNGSQSATKTLLALTTNPALLQALHAASLKKTYTPFSQRRTKRTERQQQPKHNTGQISLEQNLGDTDHRESTGLTLLRAYLEQKETRLNRV